MFYFTRFSQVIQLIGDYWSCTNLFIKSRICQHFFGMFLLQRSLNANQLPNLEWRLTLVLYITRFSQEIQLIGVFWICPNHFIKLLNVSTVLTCFFDKASWIPTNFQNSCSILMESFNQMSNKKLLYSYFEKLW